MRNKRKNKTKIKVAENMDKIPYEMRERSPKQELHNTRNVTLKLGAQP